MRCFIVFSLCFGIALASPRARGLGKDPSIKEFEAYFHKAYPSKEVEAEAEKNLKANEAQIDANNEAYAQGKSHFREEVKEWDDLSDEEFAKEKTGALDAGSGKKFMGLLDEKHMFERYNPPGGHEYLQNLQNFYDSQPSLSQLPKTFDARQFGIVTPTKNQGACGSCAAFAATAQHESAILDKNLQFYKARMDLSEQQLLDCAFDNDNALACEGAFIFAYPRYIVENSTGQVYHESHYPYMQGLTSANPKPDCKENSLGYWKSGARLTEYWYDYDCNEEKLKKMVYEYGTAVTVIYASDSGFKNMMADEVFDGFSNNPVNHAVQVIGWGTQYGMDYWLIKNSWGENFGDGGIGKVRIGYGGTASRCAAAGASAQGDVDPEPEKNGYLAAQSCDLNNVEAYYDKMDEGWVQFQGPNGNWISTYVTCGHGQCQPVDPHNESNSCYIICGRATCTSRTYGK